MRIGTAISMRRSARSPVPCARGSGGIGAPSPRVWSAITSVASRAAPPAVSSAMRQLARCVTVPTSTGASTQPRLPEIWCTLYARAMRRPLTAAFSME